MGSASEKISHELLVGREQTAALLRTVALTMVLAFLVLVFTGTVQRAMEEERLTKEKQVVIYFDSVVELGILSQRIPLLALSRLMVEKAEVREKARQGLISVHQQFQEKVSQLLEGNLTDSAHINYSPDVLPILEREPHNLKYTLQRFLELSQTVSKFDTITAENAEQTAELNAISMKLVGGLRALGAQLRIESEAGIKALSQRATVLLYLNGIISAFLGIGSVFYLRRGASRILKARAEAETRISHVATSLEHFADVVAHDLSSPINNISNASKMLSRSEQIKSLDSKVVFLLRTLETETERLSDMLKSLLRFSKTDQTSLRIEKFELSKEVDQLRNLFKDELKERRGDISFKGFDNIQADKSLFSVVVQNLVQNSIKYCNQDMNLQIVLTCSEPDEHFMQELILSDNGKGIPEGMHEKIFDIFFRGPGEGSKKGRGLGLATCKKIIEQHGGTIQSVPVKKGSKIVIKIPYHEGKALGDQIER